jgi:hypothetical protein
MEHWHSTCLACVDPRKNATPGGVAFSTLSAAQKDADNENAAIGSFADHKQVVVSCDDNFCRMHKEYFWS